MAHPTRQMHLTLNISEYGRHAAAWRRPGLDFTGIPDLGRYVHAAQVAERALFDSVFLADSPFYYPVRDGGGISQRVDPFVLLAMMAAETERIGLIGTQSMSYHEPYTVARKVASLDQLSGGRAGVNCVASAGHAIARNHGLEAERQHADRYVMTEENLEVITRLWDGAGVAGSSAQGVDHRGEYFTVAGTLDVPRPVTGRPIIVQAGSSPQGRDVAARWSDAIFAGSTTIPHAQDYYKDIKSRVAAAGRNPDHVTILPGVFPYIGSTEAEAKALKAEMDAYHAEFADTIAAFSAVMGMDFSGYDPDAPLPYDDLPKPGEGTYGGWSMPVLYTRMAREENLTLKQIADRSFIGGGKNLQWTVEGTPEQIADELELWFREGCGDGFAIVAPLMPETIELMADEVVPILQKRGLFRTEYEGETLRANLGVPDVRVAAPLVAG
jgi:N-acetyl-S-(2-succino)cysteine monooxygenase